MLTLSAGLTAAQPIELAALERCAGLETPELRLACFEALIADSKATEAEASETAEPPPATPAPAPAEIAASAAGVAAVDAGADAPVAEASASDVPVAESSPAPPAPAKSAQVPAIAATASPAEDQFGQEARASVEEQDGDDETLRATVVDVSRGRHDILYFHLGNGQVWRQNEARHYPYPKNGEFEVTISRGMMGDYRMRIGDNGRMVRIRRIR